MTAPGGLPVSAVKHLQRAKSRMTQARNTQLPDTLRVSKIEEALGHMADAVDIIRVNP